MDAHALGSRRLTATIGLPLVAIAAVVVYLVVVNDRLPDQVATHWGADGTADGFTSRQAMPWIVGGLMLTAVIPFSILATLLAPRTLVPTALNGLPLGMATFIGALVGGTTIRQLDGGTTAMPIWFAPAAFAVACAGGAIGSVIGGSAPPAPSSTEPAPADAERYPLDEDQTAVWSGRTPVGRALPILLTLIIGINGFIAAFTSWWQLVLVVALAVILLATASFNVTAGPTGVRVAGVFGYPRISVPLPEISDASAATVKARSYGGWGVRVRKGDTAVLTRSGPALRLTRTDGAMLHVTLDDPRQHAALISTLLDRRA